MLFFAVSIQQIQEEERQLQEAIEKSKQDAEALSKPLSPTFQGRISPHVASGQKESDSFQDASKVT